MLVGHHKTDVPTQIKYSMENKISKTVEALLEENAFLNTLANQRKKIIIEQNKVINELEKLRPKLNLSWILKRLRGDKK